MKSPLQFRVGNTVLLVACLISGISLIALGDTLRSIHNDPTIARVLTAFGGTFFGVVITVILGHIRQLDMLEILKQSLNARFISDEQQLSLVRRKFHKYHLTETQRGWQWQYSVFDFSNNRNVGNIETMNLEFDENNNQYVSTIHVGIRDDRLIIFRKPHSAEQTAIMIFPHFGRGVTRQFAGILLTDSWVLNSIVTKVIITLDPIQQDLKTGFVPEEVGNQCEIIWKELFTSKNKLAPLFTKDDFTK